MRRYPLLAIALVALGIGYANASDACGYFFVNADCPGHDLAHVKLNHKQCEAACDKRHDCKSYQQRGSDCWLKNHVCAKKELTFKGKKGFAQYTKIICPGQPPLINLPNICGYTFQNADCSGHDVRHVKLNHQRCEAFCTIRHDCKSYQHRGRDCWLKNHVCTEKELSQKGKKTFAQYTKIGCVSKKVKHGKHHHKHHKHNHHHEHNPVFKLEHHAAKHVKTFLNQLQHAIHLHHAAQQGCGYSFQNADCPGHDLAHVKLNHEQCEAACDKRHDCKSYQQRGSDCWLKNHVCAKKELTFKGKKGFAQYTKVSCGNAHAAKKNDFCYTHDQGDCYGNDIAHYHMTLNQCLHQCSKRADCKSFQHRGRDCWIKRHACTEKELIHKGEKGYRQFTKGRCNTYETCYTYDKAYCPNLHKKTIIPVMATLDKCQETCNKISKCMSFMHRHHVNCWLLEYSCTEAEMKERGKHGRNLFTKAPCT